MHHFDRGLRRRTAPALLLLLLLLMGGVAWAALSAGDLDDGFGTDGVTYLSTGERSSYSAVAEQSDGKLIVVGRDSQDEYPEKALIPGWKIRRYTTSGAIDASFGISGVMTLFGEDEDWRNDEPYDVAVDSLDRIIVVGRVFTAAASNGKGKKGGGQLTGRATIVRLTSGGALDASFGTGGVISQDLADNVGGPIPGNVLIDGSNRIIVGGFASFPYEVEVPSNGKRVKTETRDIERAFLIRYLANGSLDTSFGDGGIAVDEDTVGGDVTQAERLQLDSLAFHDGGFAALIWSRPYTGGSVEFATHELRRYLSDGTRDTSFADPQEPGTHLGKAIAVDAQDRIVVAMDDYPAPYAYQAGLIARFEADGDLDATFGVGGYRALQLTTPGDIYASHVEIDGSDRVLVAGAVVGADYHTLVIRLDANGDLDGDFGTLGFGEPLASGADDDIARDMLIDHLGQVVLVGTQFPAGTTLTTAWLARWCGD